MSLDSWGSVLNRFKSFTSQKESTDIPKGLKDKESQKSDIADLEPNHSRMSSTHEYVKSKSDHNNQSDKESDLDSALEERISRMYSLLERQKNNTPDTLKEKDHGQEGEKASGEFAGNKNNSNKLNVKKSSMIQMIPFQQELYSNTDLKSRNNQDDSLMNQNQEIIRLRGCCQNLESKLAEKEELFLNEIKSLEERLQLKEKEIQEIHQGYEEDIDSLVIGYEDDIESLKEKVVITQNALKDFSGILSKKEEELNIISREKLSKQAQLEELKSQTSKKALEVEAYFKLLSSKYAEEKKGLQKEINSLNEKLQSMNATSLKKENEFSLQIEEILSCILENVPDNDSRNYQKSITNDVREGRSSIIEEIKQRIHFLCQNIDKLKVEDEDESLLKIQDDNIYLKKMLDESMTTISNLKKIISNYEEKIRTENLDQISKMEYDIRLDLLLDRAMNAEEELEKYKGLVFQLEVKGNKQPNVAENADIDQYLEEIDQLKNQNLCHISEKRCLMEQLERVGQLYDHVLEESKKTQEKSVKAMKKLSIQLSQHSRDSFICYETEISILRSEKECLKEQLFYLERKYSNMETILSRSDMSLASNF